MLGIGLHGTAKLTAELQETLRTLALEIGTKRRRRAVLVPLEPTNPQTAKLDDNINAALAAFSGPIVPHRDIAASPPSLRTIFLGSLDKNSIILFTALRSGIVIWFAALIAMLVIILCIFALTFLAEMFIVRNYGVSILFVTPSALILAEYGSHTFNVCWTIMWRRRCEVWGSCASGFIPKKSTESRPRTAEQKVKCKRT